MLPTHPGRPSISAALVLLMALAAPARAEETKTRADFGGDNLAGLRGLVHTMAAANHPAGYVAVGANLEFFSASGFVYDGATTKRDHSRFINSYSLSVAPFRFLEAAIAINVTSDSTAGAADGLQVAVGDPRLTIKGGFELTPGLAVGGLLDLSFFSGNGFFEAAFSSTRVTLAALASYTLSSLPLSFHLNVGFLIDGSKNLLDDKAQDYERFAAQVSAFNRVVTRVGLEYATKYVGPFLEFSMEPFVGGGNPGFGGSPVRLTLGARGWLGRQRALQLLAGVDIGLAGVGPHDALLAADKYAFTIPRWNLVLRLSYRFDPFAAPDVKVVHERDPGKTSGNGGTVKPGPRLATIGGVVLDNRTGKPVWNARVRVGSEVGSEVSSLAVEPKDGSFKSYRLPVGSHKLVVTADGYHQAAVDVTLAADGTTTTIKLSPRAAIAPGTIRGSIKTVGGKTVRKATILIPQLDRTISVGRDGVFSIQLKPGEYKVVVSARGYRTQRKTLRVVEGETVILNVELHR